MNRKSINTILNKLFPVSSTILGSPRHTATAKIYLKQHPESSIYFMTEPVLGEVDMLRMPDLFKRVHIAESDYPMFLLCLKNGRVWGRNGAVISADDFFFNDVSREFNKGMNVEHSVFYTLRQKKASFISGNVAVIGTAGANIYYHWMLDVLPRIALIAKATPINEIDYFITEFAGLAFQVETLAKVGIGQDKIISSNENWKFHAKAEMLYVPSLAGPLDQPTKFQVDFLRSLFKDCMRFNKPYRRLYISRRKTARRAIVNEKEIIHCLSIYQFEIIFCEDLTVAEQATLFSEAATIICSHGSALTNLVFCMPGTIVLDIFNKSHINPCFWYISQILHLNYNYITGISRAIDENPKNDNTEVDIDAVKFKLMEIGLAL